MYIHRAPAMLRFCPEGWQQWRRCFFRSDGTRRPRWPGGGRADVRLALLALLAKGQAHGYELKQALESRLGAAYPPFNIGQIYVTLARLEKAGLIRGHDVEQSGRPNKRTYELTPAGHEAVAAWLEETSDEPRVRDEFFMKLALAQV